MEKTLAAPRSAIERGRSNPTLAIAVILGVLLLIAWVAWAIYVTRDNGANAGLGVVLSWPVLLAALVLIASPFVGLYLLIDYLRSADEAEEGPSIAEDSADPDDETESEPTAESDEDDPSDEHQEEAEEDDAADDEDGPEETDPDEEPPSGDKAPVSAD